jgi:hypothetical protein
VSDRRQYQQEYRQRQKEKLRKLKEIKPGQYIRENPDYGEILAAIEAEQAKVG